jgi:methionyl-tRNA synthetase
MAEKKPFYLTTTIPYVNADPHIGFALEIIQADIVARYKRLMGHEVFFSTGTDEHGQKIYQKAKEVGQDVQAYVDHYANEFRKLKDALNLSNDTFVRTTDSHHVAAAQELWRRCTEAGDIYKKKYKGLYCVGDEMFLKESDLVDGKCPNHPNMTPVEIEEENYFFRLSKYQDRVLEYLAQPGVIIPDWRREEAVTFVSQGLEDFSISREKARMSWGVPVPGDDTQVMYVWFDALANYISTLGWPDDPEGSFKKFWQEGEAMQMAGKDQIRFQSIMWQAMLDSAGIKNTDRVVYHGFITSGGQKMSKSLGNVIEPFALVQEYGADVLRYFLARHIHPFEDSDFTMERFIEVYNANLANGLGNLVARIMKLAEDHLEKGTKPEVAAFPKNYTDAFENFDGKGAIDEVFRAVQRLDQKITDTQPFKVVKTDPEAGNKLIFELTQELYVIGRMLHPFMPRTSEVIKNAVIENKKPETLFPRRD